jgi:hypothetical protein
MADSDANNDWLYWAIPLLLVIGVAIWLVVTSGDQPSNFGYEID